jgi:hypothetical protein
VGISALDAAPDLFIPYWSTLQEDTQLILSSTEDATVQAAFFDAKGAIIKAELFELLADELVSVDLSDLGLKGEGSIVVRSKSASGEETNIAAETIIRGGKKEALFSFSPANARKGVWTSFAQAWYGSYGSLDEDELLIFSPAGDLASTLASLGILPGRPANRYPEDLVVEIYDDLGNEINAVTIPVGSLTRMRLREIAGQAYSGPGTLRITPVLVSPGGVPTPIPRPPEPEDVVFITYLKRHVFDEMKVSKDALKSGYLFSEELGKR